MYGSDIWLGASMRSKKTSSALMPWLLGATNGLLVGLAVEEFRINRLRQTMSQARQDYLQNHNWVVDFFEPHRTPLVPLICVITFATAAYLIQRYFRKHRDFLFVGWLAIGFAALSIGWFMWSKVPDVFSFLWLTLITLMIYAIYRLWKTYPQSDVLLWPIVGTSSLILIAFIAQIVAIFYYWPELNSPLTWLYCLSITILISSMYGFFVQFLFTKEL